MGWTYTNYCYYDCAKPKTIKEKKNLVAKEVKSWYNGEAVILHDHLAADPYIGKKAVTFIIAVWKNLTKHA